MANHDANPSATLSGLLPVSPILCRILENRGIHTLTDAKLFLEPNLEDLHDPSLLDGLDWAIDRTRQAISRGEKIMVHGDYDVDGITSTALLVRVLRLLNADVSWHIPNRQREGYDIGRIGVDLAKERGVSLIITVDCGTSAVEAVAYAREMGIDVIVTDHHEVGAELAQACVIVNPRKPGCSYPFKDLAGVGVAYKFGEALIRESGLDVAVYRRRFADLAAVGTVCDIVPLLGENRILVKVGMEELPRSGKKGLKALLDIAGLSQSSITSQMLGYGLGPRINAAGRLADASVALELFLTTDQGRATELAQNLDAVNKERQIEQERMTNEALLKIADQRMHETSKVLVLSSQGWHPGIVGIVAGKITEQYCRPAILVAINDAGEVGVGSARSIPAFNVFEALGRCSHLLHRFGGHRRAAGLTISSDNLADFRTEMNRIADDLITDTDMVPQLEIDVELDLESVTLDLARELQLLEPCGHANTQPIFMSRNALVQQRSRIGSTGNHLKLKLGTATGRTVECVAFGWGAASDAFQLGSLIDVCYNIQVNHFAGNESVQAVLRDARIASE